MGQGDGQEKEGSAPSRAPLSYEKTPCCQSQHGQVRGDTSLGQDWGPQGPLMPDPQALRKQSQRFPDGGRGEKQAGIVEDGGPCTGSAAIPPLVPGGCPPRGADFTTMRKKRTTYPEKSL